MLLVLLLAFPHVHLGVKLHLSPGVVVGVDAVLHLQLGEVLEVLDRLFCLLYGALLDLVEPLHRLLHLLFDSAVHPAKERAASEPDLCLEIDLHLGL